MTVRLACRRSAGWLLWCVVVIVARPFGWLVRVAQRLAPRRRMRLPGLRLRLRRVRRVPVQTS